MKSIKMFKPYDTIEFFERLVPRLCCSNVIAGSKNMASIDAHTNRDRFFYAVYNVGKLFELSADT